MDGSESGGAGPRHSEGRGHGWKVAFVAGLAGALIGGGTVALSSGYLVRTHLLQNPEILAEASDRLQQRGMAEAVEANRAAFETPFAGAWAGAENGDVILVEFFDYACGYCRKSNADIDRLLREDPNLKVVWREWPVLGEPSELAAQASLAAAQAGRYRAFYDTLFGLGRPDPATIERARQAAGVPAEAVARMTGSEAARQELGKNYELARAIGATGTPTFVVGDQVLQGAVGYEALKDAIAAARAGR
ncbi:MAG: DsbA family protein [Allosphingosinicella sp.]